MNQLSVSGGTTFGGILGANTFNATTQYNIGGNRVLSVGGTNNLFAGINAGIANTGYSNSFFGRDVGSVNTTGSSNSFFGIYAGQSNTTGSNNAFFGPSAGAWNTTGDYNTGIGFGANVQSANLTYATAIGAGARVFTSNTVVLGTGNDTVNIPGGLFLQKHIQVGTLSTDPFTCTSAKSGCIYFNTSSNFLKFCNSGAWYIIPNTSQFSESSAMQQQAQIDSQQKQIDEQRKQIERLTKIVCAINSNADICRQ